ncbi:class III extradiol dioxygenase subunit B-like domain-containing protein [Rhodococcus sp. NPDC056743]|uniref:class III extradiol dioxygenase subunit B-like domain-containing protein n=1 Tax=Rhodococcus sp. NPDC056743 TaxID=3345934 RepID=UPI00367164A6
MFTAAALVPSPPLLVPQLSGDSAPADEVRAETLRVVRELAATAPRWIALGADTEKVLEIAGTVGVGQGEVGTFAGFGADVRTQLDGNARGPVNPELPLAVLVAGWLREQSGRDVSVDVHLISTTASVDECRALGAKLREILDAGDEPVGLLILADGASTLSPKAPGSFDERAAPVQAVIDDALEVGDRAALLELNPALCEEIGASGRAVWQVLASVFTEQPDAVVHYSGAPLGVGYHVGMWRP